VVSPLFALHSYAIPGKNVQIEETVTSQVGAYGGGPPVSGYRRQIAAFALQHRLPMIGVQRNYAEAGSLLSYGATQREVQGRAAVLVDKILKGAKPADLPVEQPTKFELVINLKTAKALDLPVPPILLLQADKVIE
jgi:putative tryptophan/tyrosine transport system substrate-binding protein